MRDARLGRPRAETRDIVPFSNRDGCISVRRNRPVCVRRFVEENGSCKQSMLAQNRLCKIDDLRALCNGPERRHAAKRIAQTGSGAVLGLLACGFEQAFGHNLANDAEAGLLKRRASIG